MLWTTCVDDGIDDCHRPTRGTARAHRRQRHPGGRPPRAGHRQVGVSLMRGEPDFADARPHRRRGRGRAARRPHRLSRQPRRTDVPRGRGGEAGAREQGRYDPATEILATTGATLGLYCALTAVLADGDEVLLPDPIYDAYRSPIALAGGVRAVRARARSSADRFTLTVEALEKAVTPGHARAAAEHAVESGRHRVHPRRDRGDRRDSCSAAT